MLLLRELKNINKFVYYFLIMYFCAECVIKWQIEKRLQEK